MDTLISLVEQKILCETFRLRRPIIIEGGPGTGKTTLGHWLFTQSKDAIYLNCKEIPREKLESVFDSKFSRASTTATFLIDGIELLSLHLQAKLLELIQLRSIHMVSIAHLSLAKKVVRGEFRPDLYAFLNGHCLFLKPLYGRKELPEILKALAFSHANIELDQPALDLLCRYDWPGNLRQVTALFLNMRQHPVLPTLHDWSHLLRKNFEYSNMTINSNVLDKEAELQLLRKHGLKKFLRQIEQSMVRKIFENNQGHVRKTLQELKISSGAFYRAITP